MIPVHDDHHKLRTLSPSSMREFSGTFLGLFNRRAATEQVRQTLFYSSEILLLLGCPTREVC